MSSKPLRNYCIYPYIEASVQAYLPSGTKEQAILHKNLDFLNYLVNYEC